MTPTRVQRIFAEGWPWRLWLAIVPLSVVCWALVRLPVARTDFDDASSLLWLACFAVVWFIVGLGAAIVTSGEVVGSMMRAQARRNGGPFKPGDLVLVLAGEHRGRTGRVYSMSQGDTVRVELGDDLRLNFGDIFDQAQVLRISEEM